MINGAGFNGYSSSIENQCGFMICDSWVTIWSFLSSDKLFNIFFSITFIYSLFILGYLYQISCILPVYYNVK